MKDPGQAFFPKAITLAANVNRRGVMQESVEHGGGQNGILERVMMPPFSLVLLDEANPEVSEDLQA